MSNEVSPAIKDAVERAVAGRFGYTLTRGEGDSANLFTIHFDAGFGIGFDLSKWGEPGSVEPTDDDVSEIERHLKRSIDRAERNPSSAHQKPGSVFHIECILEKAQSMLSAWKTLEQTPGFRLDEEFAYDVQLARLGRMLTESAEAAEAARR